MITASTTTISAATTSADDDEAEEADQHARDRAPEPALAQRARHREPEEDVAEEVDHGARPTTATSSAVGSVSVGCWITSSSPTAETMIPATRTTCRYV